ncbi:acyltransferase [Pedobacter kyungheensis]|uniref:Acyltransferase n=1 Tax=Pedobacter kyungheensis TaxID=1069985 RepID=A0A0C1D925_9SPHI|nr:MBOAT family O-acyltransferase [Pedobacter kyungheensis]KIA93816.1 acyltransferase [Pedobacter kyungheensis]
MLFNSAIFILLLVLTFIVYYIPFLKKLQVQILILSSLIFYAYSQPSLLLLLIVSALINIAVSYLIVNGNPKMRRFYATTGVIINLAVLVFFKYSPLFAKTFLNTDAGFGQFLLMLPLPIGISFYTFEGLSLLIDVYSNKHKDILTIEKSLSKHFYKTLFFISFFPHLIAGPILKAYEFYPQIGEKKFKNINWSYVFEKLVQGYFLKMVIADNLTNFTFWMEYPYFKTIASFDLILIVFGYSIQIFSDFAGYSLIALGIAKLFGYDLIDNFNFPYISSSFSEFWRRWHISLSTFLKEYLYIPLGGNRRGRVRTYTNLIITMGLGGLWHGAAWSYAIWGLYHGLALAIERFFLNNFKLPQKNTFTKILMGIVVFLVVTISWVFFKLPVENVIEYFKSIYANQHLAHNGTLIVFILLYSTPVVIYHFLYLANQNPMIANITQKYKFIAYGCMLFMIAVNSGPSGSFIYFQF